MEGFLVFCSHWYGLFLILGFVSIFGVCGYFIDRNTNYLEIERKKKAMMERSMNVKDLKDTLKNNNVSLGSVSGNENSNSMNVGSAPLPDTDEDLYAPIDLK